MSDETPITACSEFGERDFCSRDGAYELKAKIEDYWAKRGYHVEVLLLSAGFHPAIRAARYDLRSNMIGGMPRPSPAQIERAA